MAIVYVSHRLPEVLDVANRITVLRDGVSQGTYAAATMSESDVVAMMIGRPLETAFPTIAEAPPGRGRCSQVSQAVAAAASDRSTSSCVGARSSASPAPRATARCSSSAPWPVSNRRIGTVTCAGKRVHLSSPPGAIRAGIILLSADRKRESIFTALERARQRHAAGAAQVRRLGFVRRKRERGPVNDLVDRLRLKAASIEQPTQYLSGGNQQKVALMRPFLRGDLNVILADEPTQGVDVGARLDIYHALRDKAAEGTTVLVKSSDAIELAGHLRSGRRHVARRDRRRDPPRRARRAADHRRHHRAGLGARRPPWRVTPTEHASVRPKFQLSRWLPIVAMMLLIMLLGAYTNSEDSSFLSEFNLNGVMVATLPLALAAMGQTSALMVKAFDVSVGALITLCVVVSSFVLGPESRGRSCCSACCS